MISTNDFHTGLTFEFEGQLYEVVEFQHVKPGKGAAFVRSKIKNLNSGAVTERTFRAGEKVKRAHLDRKEMSYLYRSSDQFCLMDLTTYEQITLSEKEMGEAIKYLKENDTLTAVVYEENVIGVELPVTVELAVVETEPGVKGDTASGGNKPAVVETGLTVQVPLFISIGDVLRIDTRSGAYIERV
ncbi:MAG TPA: elongation factor P [Firmicutes bacterium]|jgi:elongation factor P|nr:elongation factor P [Bacillota bacterium]